MHHNIHLRVLECTKKHRGKNTAFPSWHEGKIMAKRVCFDTPVSVYMAALKVSVYTVLNLFVLISEFR